MKKFFAWFIKPMVLSFFGVLVLSILTWFEAPLFAFDGNAPFESARARWILIAIWFALWAGWFALGWVRLKLANRRLMKSVAGADAPPPRPGEHESAAEVALLTTRMQEALAVLRRARLGGRTGGLYQLPWYMFVGAPGSGKTTALVHSGLKFPLSEAMGKAALGGVGGTRNCDWWFTDEAVLLDTAGRYTTQDSYSEVDKAAWGGFLRLLKRNRPRRPINGVIVALSVADLLQQDDAARRAQALAVRSRIKELHDELGIRFPVYVIVTKCDLLAGFVEYFDNLGRDERSQVWGVSFPLAGADAVGAALAQFPAEFAALEQQLQARVFNRMQQERDLQRRALVYNFPQQFAGLGDALDVFLNDTFGATSFDEPALLRGVYFTSGTQEGSPIDRVMSTLAASFGLDRKVLPANLFGGRSYFITRLLREVIFPEAGLAGANIRLERNRRWLQLGAFGLAALMLVVAAASIATSYINNINYVRDVAVRVQEATKLARVVPEQPSPVVTLPLLNALRDIPGGFKDQGKPVPWNMGLGLYQGEKLGEGATAAYQRVLRLALMPRIVARMEEELRRDGANNADYLYELLRVYLMLGDPSHFDADAVRAWIEYDWNTNLPEANEAQQQELMSHAGAMLSNRLATPPQMDAALVAQVRLSLARMPMGQRIYNRVKREMALENLNDFDVASVAGRDAPLVLTRASGLPLTRGIPGMYTVDGYRKFMAKIDIALADVVQDSWVLDKREAVNSIDAAVQMKAVVAQMYYDDYIRQWDALLADVVLIPFNGLDQASRSVGILAGNESPLRKFLQAAARQTTLEKVSTPKSGVDAASDAVKNLRDAAKRRLAAAMSSGEADAPQTPDKPPQNPVDAHFDGLHKMVEAGTVPGAPPTPSALDTVLVKLRDVATYFDSAAAAKAAGAPPPPADALTRLKRETADMAAPVAVLVKSIDASGTGLTQGSERARIDALWSASPGPFCKRAIEGRYPMLRSASEDVTADDFGRFFGPGGLADDFFQRYLQAYIDTSGAQWRWRAVNGATLGMGQDVLDEFQRAAMIRDRYFMGGGRTASMRFDIKILSADPTISELVLNIDGQPVKHEAYGKTSAAASIVLPSGKGGNVVSFTMIPRLDSELRTEGPWAWMRMVDHGVLEATAQNERFKLSFDMDGRKVSYEILASSVNNAYRRDAVEQFRCLDKL